MVFGSPTAGGLAGYFRNGTREIVTNPVAATTSERRQSPRAPSRCRTAAKTTAIRRNAQTGTAIGASLRSTASMSFSFSVGVVVVDVGGGRQAVLAAVAVHSCFAGERFAVALEHEVDEPRVDTEVGVRGGAAGSCLVTNAFDEHAGEQEVGDDGDLFGTQTTTALDGGRYARIGKGDE